MKSQKIELAKSIEGCILGTAVGDSLGLPVEFLKPSRIPIFLGKELKQSFFLGKGFVSDDTDHTCFVAQSLCVSFEDPLIFQKDLSWKLRLWLLSLPAGIGLATMKSIIKLWLGFSAKKSGVFSAGNGPAMRSPLLGIVFGEDVPRLKEFVRVSSEITHSDPKAYYGALVVAYATHASLRMNNLNGNEFLSDIFSMCPDFDLEFKEVLLRVVKSVEKKEKLITFAKNEGWKNGVSGYIVHSVAAIIHVWLRQPDNFSEALEEIIFVGGDTDSTAAILGAIIASGKGIQCIPNKYLTNLSEWPRNISFMKELSLCLANAVQEKHATVAPSTPWVFSFIRNLLFFCIIIPKAIRRLFPPY